MPICARPAPLRRAAPHASAGRPRVWLSRYRSIAGWRSTASSMSREVAEHVRPDGLALEAAGETSDGHLVDRDREVIGPELVRRSTNGRSLVTPLLQARDHLAGVDRLKSRAIF